MTMTFPTFGAMVGHMQEMHTRQAAGWDSGGERRVAIERE